MFKPVLAAVLMLSSASAFAADFIYKPASPIEVSQPLQKVEGTHKERFFKEYEIQRLSPNYYWVSTSNCNVSVLVGDKGVLLIDAPIHSGKKLLKAIKSITDKPLKGIVYSHAHADHIGDSALIMQELNNPDIAIYATQEVKDHLRSHGVSMPAPVTHVIGSTFKFENFTFDVFSNFDGHTRDNTAFVLEDGNRKILHAVDLVHPDQLEFRSFSNVEDAIAYKNDIHRLMEMDWDVMVTGHSNLGYKEDVQFVKDYIADVQAFIHQGFAHANFQDHLRSETPFGWYSGYTNQIIDFAYQKMADKYRDKHKEEFDIVGKSHVRVLF